MKKVLLIMLFLFPLIAWGQTEKPKAPKITKEVSYNGANLAQANFCVIPGGHGANNGITPEIVFRGKEVLNYGINVTLNGWLNFQENSPMIIKLSNGDIIEGKAVSDGTHDAYDYREVDSSAYYKFTKTSYSFSKEDIDKLRNHGIVKIRVSDGVNNYDHNVGALTNRELLEGFDFLDSYIKNKPSIYDGF